MAGIGSVWSQPTAEMRAAWQDWLADRPRFVRSIAECFNPWSMYRLTTTGQRCQVLAFADDGTVRVYAEHETLGPMTGTEVFGISPADLVPWDGAERANWVIEREDFDEEPDEGGFSRGTKITFRIDEDRNG